MKKVELIKVNSGCNNKYQIKGTVLLIIFINGTVPQ